MTDFFNKTAQKIANRAAEAKDAVREKVTSESTKATSEASSVPANAGNGWMDLETQTGPELVDSLKKFMQDCLEVFLALQGKQQTLGDTPSTSNLCTAIDFILQNGLITQSLSQVFRC
jgi:hypothetical protein